MVRDAAWLPQLAKHHCAIPATIGYQVGRVRFAVRVHATEDPSTNSSANTKQAQTHTHKNKHGEREREICAYIALESSFIVDLKHRQTRE